MNPKDLHKEIPSDMNLDWVFAFREKRVILNDFTISWKNRTFLLNKPSIALKRKRATVLENLKGEVKIWFNNRFLEFKEITKDTLQQIRKRNQMMKASGKKVSSKPWKPATNHPWRLQNKSFLNRINNTKSQRVGV